MVCLVDNGPFTAAAIAFSEDEFRQFSDPTDTRFKEWYRVEESKLRYICPDFDQYLRVQGGANV